MPDERVTMSDRLETPSSISRDGKVLLFSRIAPDSGRDLWVLRLDQKQHEPQAIMRTRLAEDSPHFLPDGRWILRLRRVRSIGDLRELISRSRWQDRHFD